MAKIIKNTLETPTIQTCPSCGSSWELENHEPELSECPVCGAYIEVREPKLSVKERTINEVMNGLDFKKIHKTMVALDWSWWNQGVPSIGTLKKSVRDQLEYAWEHKCSTGTGGFWVTYEEETEDDHPMLRIGFEVSWAGPCWVSKQDDQMQYA